MLRGADSSPPMTFWGHSRWDVLYGSHQVHEVGINKQSADNGIVKV